MFTSRSLAVSLAKIPKFRFETADLIHQYEVKDAGHAALIGRICSEEMYAQVHSAFQATPRKTIIAENSIHTIKPMAAASPP